jgi:hypothetical protein
MAIDDVISDYETSLGSGVYLSIQPASGDEWVVTHFSMCNATSIGGWGLVSHTSTSLVCVGTWGGTGTADLAFGVQFGMNEGRFLVTNSEYIRIYNGAGSTANAGYSAIKSKD